VPVAVFLLFFTSQKINTKRSPIAVKLFGDFFGPEDIQWAKEVPEGGSEGSTTHQGVPRSPGAPRWVVPTSVASRTASSPYKFPNIPKPPEKTLDEKFCRRKPLYPRETNRDHFLILCWRGESSPEAIIIISEVSMMRRE
jgi:hypothetical protein